MKVSVKDFNISMDLGNNGITFDVYDTSENFLGDLRLGRGTIEWCKGKTKAGNGIQVKWPELLAFFAEVDAKQKEAAKKAKPAARKPRKAQD